MEWYCANKVTRELDTVWDGSATSKQSRGGGRLLGVCVTCGRVSVAGERGGGTGTSEKVRNRKFLAVLFQAIMTTLGESVDMIQYRYSPRFLQFAIQNECRRKTYEHPSHYVSFLHQKNESWLSRLLHKVKQAILFGLPEWFDSSVTPWGRVDWHYLLAISTEKRIRLASNMANEEKAR